ncbi:hypothetical protein A9Z63_00175 [Moraxella lacunata]|uniref:Uncharacterized protein n=1 Tax=Moraxella lacunata TaxID=477 RepID=A0A1B8Q5V7_MORLA|nr:hypothetical protein A9Z63_00175 [Moraxella lacunata]OBX65139.1 hypothetical protein A9309_03575 [Moraxella lacunata]
MMFFAVVAKFKFAIFRNGSRASDTKPTIKIIKIIIKVHNAPIKKGGNTAIIRVRLQTIEYYHE